MSDLADKYITAEGHNVQLVGHGKRIVPRSDLDGLIATIRRGLNIDASISQREEAFTATRVIKDRYGIQ
jgi:hypothetical protein